MLNRTKQFYLEQLEDRQMMAGDAFAFIDGASLTSTTPTTKFPIAEIVSLPLPSGEVGPRPTEAFDPSLLSEAERDLFMGLPLLDSNPGAAHTIHLDFTGHSQSSFENHRGTFPLKASLPIITPPYDTNAIPSQFSPGEQMEIKQIWARVAEDFAPFDVNVTTHYYGELTDGRALKVAIGGHPTDWYIDYWDHVDNEKEVPDPSGTSSYNSFTDPNKPNVVFVFSKEIWFDEGFGGRDGDGRRIELAPAVATTASHEAGHAFGLWHITEIDAGGEVVDNYGKGTAEWTPIMGDSLASDRTTWAKAPNEEGPSVFQDDVQILTSVLGQRRDDHSGGRRNATPLVGSINTPLKPLTGKGIIEKQADIDMFKFTSPGGQVQVEVKAAPHGPNLWVLAEMLDKNGRLVATGNFGATNFVTNINAVVPAGTYYLRLHGFNSYGHMGQYTVKVTHASIGPNTSGPTTANPTTTNPKTAIPREVTTSTQSSKLASSDGNSNGPINVTVPENSTMSMGGKQAKTKRTLIPLDMSLELKDSAFDSLYSGFMGR